MKTHKEHIWCPNCGKHQVAKVEHTNPFWTYIHECITCGYTIMESEWNKVQEDKFIPCCDCDGHDACWDFGCAIQQGIIDPKL